MTEHQTLRAPARRQLGTPTDLSSDATRDVAAGLNRLLADTFALYLKTKNFHWHLSGAHFRDWHLMLDDHGAQLIAMTDPLAERVRKLGETTIRSISDITARQSLLDNTADYVDPMDMLAELLSDNRQLLSEMRRVHGICDDVADIASTSLIENWIDETETRSWFLYELGRGATLR
ncbi:MAG: DNA starvation/stationary phase protection protein [Maritimibacter sp.]|nr:DNA starvation/stationary phase protection protein [Maritimibacter sp.]